MPFLSFAVSPIVVDVKILAGCREGGMTQIVADQPKIDGSGANGWSVRDAFCKYGYLIN
jgi:hypothetical protein